MASLTIGTASASGRREVGEQPIGLSSIPTLLVAHRRGILVSLAWGIFAHGMVLTNKYAFHDDAGLIGVGATDSSGRWALRALSELESNAFGGGSPNYSTQFLNGLVTLILSAIICEMVLDMCRVRSTPARAAFSGIFMTCPVLTCTFGYMYTAPYYYIGLLMGTVGVALLVRARVLSLVGLGCVALCFSIGVYQAYIPFLMCVALVCCVSDVLTGAASDAELIRRYSVRAILFVGSIGLYLVVTKLINASNGVELTTYKGISSMGAEPIGVYVSRVLLSFREFLRPTAGGMADILVYGTRRVYQFSALGAIGLVLIRTIKMLRGRPGGAGLLLASLAAYPLASSFIYVMAEADYVGSLMELGRLGPFLLLVTTLEVWRGEEPVQCSDATRGASDALVARPLVVLRAMVCAALVMVSLSWTRYANVCYLKAEVAQSEAISWMTTLVTQIKSSDGYDDELPVAFLRPDGVNDASLSSMEVFSDVRLQPWDIDARTLVNNYTWLTFMRTWCGYAPTLAGQEETDALMSSPEVEAMSCYPDAGSIRVIDGTVVVKL